MIVKLVNLVILSNSDNQVLMIFKKTGHGKGLVNFPGGKIKTNESIELGAKREFFEETGLTIDNLNICGKLDFYYPDSLLHSCTVYKTNNYSGNLIETSEARGYWENINSIPYKKMWPTDKSWLPELLKGNYFFRSYYFDKNNKFVEIKKY